MGAGRAHDLHCRLAAVAGHRHVVAFRDLRHDGCQRLRPGAIRGLEAHGPATSRQLHTRIARLEDVVGPRHQPGDGERLVTGRGPRLSGVGQPTAGRIVLLLPVLPLPLSIGDRVVAAGRHDALAILADQRLGGATGGDGVGDGVRVPFGPEAAVAREPGVLQLVGRLVRRDVDVRVSLAKCVTVPSVNAGVARAEQAAGSWTLWKGRAAGSAPPIRASCGKAMGR